MTWTIAADRERCIGSGMCTLYAGETFTQDGEAKVVLLDPAGDDRAAIDTAIEACPTHALTLTTDEERT